MKVTADDIAQLLASPTPRSVPAHLVRLVRKQRAPFSRAVGGLAFVLIGALFAGMFFPWRLADDVRLSVGSAETAAGLVTAVNPTNMKVNKQQVMETAFTFTPPDGQVRTGACYSTGASWSVGEKVTVYYLAQEPAIARIEGGRLNEVGWGGALVMIFPLSGVAMLVWFVREYGAARRVLIEGRMAEVDIQKVEATNMKVNHQVVYRITISSPTMDGAPVVIRRTNPAEIDQFRNRAEQKQSIFALYDPNKPSRMIFPESLIDS